MKIIYGFILSLHAFVGIGAVIGGMAAVTNPIDPLGAPASMLEGCPFKNFFIPGLVLLLVVGLGNFTVGFIAAKKAVSYGLLSGAMGAILVGWIIIQCFMLRTIAMPHVIFFLIGTAQGLLALAVMWHRNEFPMNIVKLIVGR